MIEEGNYRGYMLVSDWFGEPGIRIMSSPSHDDKTGVTTRTTVATVDSISSAERYIDDLMSR